MTTPGDNPGDGSLIALTGGTGFLGSHIADALLAAGHRVRAAVRRTSDQRWLADKPLEIVTTDLLDAASCRRFVAGAVGVIHCAGAVSAADDAAYRKANVITTTTLLAATTEADADTFLLISSLAAHGPAGPDAPAHEDDLAKPITAYGRSKLKAEQAVLFGGERRLRRVVLRPPALYGPRDRGFLPVVRAARRGWTAWLGRRLQAVSLVDGRDAAAAAVALLDCSDAVGIFFVDDGQIGYDRRALAAALSEMAGRRVRSLTVPLGLVKLAARLSGGWRAGLTSLLTTDRIRDLDTPGWVCRGDKLTRLTGFSATRRAGVGLSETMAFYREQGWL